MTNASSDGRRFAIYLLPPRGHRLAAWGAGWLGWDIERGEPAAHRGPPGVPAALQDTVTRRCRTYGFHLTLKAPFRLCRGVAVDDLLAGAAEIAGAQPAFEAQFRCETLSNFVCLRPTAHDELRQLANAFVEQLDPLRAELTEEEIQRRRPETLSPEARERLRRWGYPHVFEAFRPHYTLTDPVSPDDLAVLLDALRTEMAALVAAPVPISEVCLVQQADGGSGFRLLSRLQLGL